MFFGASSKPAFIWPEARLPELYCGFQRDPLYFSLPAQYPVSCAPQAWAAGSSLLALRTILGLTPTPTGLSLRPRLPVWLREVRVSRLRVGGASIDLAVNDRNEVTINALRGGLAHFHRVARCRVAAVT
ncbi:MAG: hypothetical protein KatS3mg060_3538 [Dehalococcoidia bacterium]|nr:MAG: hypothetical protein KatS3mg060_3538 [Dehalococcoidia bacterium]